jgi:hypothetical protein
LPTRTTIPGQPPHVCSFTLRGTDPEGFFTGETLSGWDPRAFISISYARQLARELGYVHPDEARALVVRSVRSATALTGCSGRLTGCRRTRTRWMGWSVTASTSSVSGWVARPRRGRRSRWTLVP